MAGAFIGLILCIYPQTRFHLQYGSLIFTSAFLSFS
jgi:hypothetical protein